MDTHVKVNNTWRKGSVKENFVKVNGTFRRVSRKFTKVNNTWRYVDATVYKGSYLDSS